jgi:hypothetical protein
VNEELQLLRKISNTGNGKNANVETQASVLTIVRRLEIKAGPSPTLLSDAVANNLVAKSLLDGEWFLQYTAPSEIDDVTIAQAPWEAIEGSEGESNISTRKFKGAGKVSGGGIPVDASNTLALQTFDIDKLRVKNVITTGIGKVTVGGTFRQSTSVPLRAIIAFDTAKIELNLGPTIDISFLFGKDVCIVMLVHSFVRSLIMFYLLLHLNAYITISSYVLSLASYKRID